MTPTEGFLPSDQTQPYSDPQAAEEEDQDFVPDSANVKLTPSQADDNQDSDSDDSDFEDDTEHQAEAKADAEVAAGTKRSHDETEIDQDEVEAAIKERQELIQQAGGEENLGKRKRRQLDSTAISSSSSSSKTEDELIRKQAESEWDQMKKQTSSSDPPHPPPLIQEKMIKVLQTFKFAGQVETKERLLPASHPDAIAYLSSQSSSSATSSGTTTSTTTYTSSSDPLPVKSKPPPGPRPRRKKNGSLATLSASLTAKPVKLNTLEKSKMDWESFKSSAASQQEMDEIEAQTKGGASGLGNMKGYLERKDFLDRVEKRLHDQSRSL